MKRLCGLFRSSSWFGSARERSKFLCPMECHCFLPPFHAFEFIGGFFLVMALIYIKKKMLVHQRWIYSAMICSFVFLLSYVRIATCRNCMVLNRDGNLNDNELLKAGSAESIFILLSHIALLPLVYLLFYLHLLWFYQPL